MAGSSRERIGSSARERVRRRSEAADVSTASFEVDEAALREATEILARTRVGILIVAYQQERFIESVLERIPRALRELFAEILIIDDSSADATFDVAKAAGERLGFHNLLVLRTPHNRGYGGNQKIASRMIRRADALRGRMPVYKWLGNQLLTAIENRMLGSRLSEFHSGYRAYKVDALRSIPFELNSNEFHFDTEVLIQLIRTGRTIVEIPIPTFYGDEISRVNGMKYALNCVKAVTKVRLSEVGLFYEPRFDFGSHDESGYLVKTADNSLHQYILGGEWDPTWHVADLGANRGVLSAQLARRVAHVTSADIEAPTQAGDAHPIALDLNADFDVELGRRRYDAVLALDVIEHLDSPEEAVRKIAAILKPGGVLYASTGNIAYVVLRLSLLFGQFNYGKRGILDLTHSRLFTIYSFRKLLTNGGFAVETVRGFGPPIRDMVGESATLRVADATSGALGRWWPRLFAFNFLVVAQKEEELDEIYDRTAASAADSAP
jgi:2-polyprenyl-3-methyl-5-hydroxy-6-metoxy-1,4-benzoquinol methylase